jgi:DMSO/TMAO reductase YedYZ molybdopterin-dependent catalytic subunit
MPEPRIHRGIDRRSFLARLAGGASLLALGACDRLSRAPTMRDILGGAESLTMRAQRFLLGDDSLATEYTEADLSPAFRANGSTDPADEDYRALAANGFADWRLEITGMVDRPGSYSLDDLRARPSRTQITRHDCVEGWSCIGKWKGAPLGALLDEVGVQAGARYVVFRCFDELEQTFDDTGRYYESIDLIDAYHPQTILAYEMNDATLPVPHGAPLRVRVERQLGYKMAKYLRAIELVDDISPYGRGNGGFWPDRGYQWYAGI